MSKRKTLWNTDTLFVMLTFSACPSSSREADTESTASYRHRMAWSVTERNHTDLLVDASEYGENAERGDSFPVFHVTAVSWHWN